MTAAPMWTAPARDTTWMARAYCRPGMSDRQIAGLCPHCPVREQCFDDGIAVGDTTTYRAGMSSKKRTWALKAAQIPIATPPTMPVRTKQSGRRADIDLDLVQQLRGEGRTWEDIGRRLGTTAETVRLRYARSGRPHTGKVRGPGRTPTDLDTAAIRKQLAAGQSIAGIARAHGVNRSTIERHIQRAREQGLIP